MGKTIAIIPARAGSKGIPRKNLIPVCGHPLIAWSIHHAKQAQGIDSVWVSSDGDEILEVAKSYGASIVRRPVEFAGDTASSESAWRHALDTIENTDGPIARIIGMQPTSPVRAPHDLSDALQRYTNEALDSLLSVVEIEDFFMWRTAPDGLAQSVNYDWHERKRRQNIEKRYLENGSFYIFTPQLLRETNNRLGGKIGMHIMGRHTMFQIDHPDDLQLCEAMMRGFGLDTL